MSVVIAGGGIGGLATALMLHEAGIDCQVHERSEAIRELGVGINLLPHAVQPLAELGLLDRLDAVAIRTAELRYTHRLGHQIVSRRCGLDAGHPVPQLSIHRGRLLGVLHRAVVERLGPAAVRTGRRLAGFTQDTDAVRARIDDGTGGALGEVKGDALIGADGIHSVVRARLFPAEGPPRWNGVLMWRGAAEWPTFLDGRTMIVAGGTQAKLVVYPIAPGTKAGSRLTNWAICIRTAAPGSAPRRQDWTRPADPADVLGNLARFHSPHLDIGGLVAATPVFYEYPMCDRDPLPSWTQERVTLVGDAAHPMYPMGSNGAGQAILDAAALRRCLQEATDTRAALRAYEQERRPATTELVLRNRRGGPEGVIDEVERRAPRGFARLADVIDPAEVDDALAGYQAASGGPTRRGRQSRGLTGGCGRDRSGETTRDTGDAH
jgi:2-polyprenyl-6-methoxyphenol hydroxylase-like FAD-dependent oxidoreductase